MILPPDDCFLTLNHPLYAGNMYNVMERNYLDNMNVTLSGQD